MVRKIFARAASAACVLSVCASTRLAAQAWNYPSFHPPAIVEREFNFGVADAGRDGTSALFQWREGIDANTEFEMETGFATPEGADTHLLLGVAGAVHLMHSSADMPIDMLLTGGIYGAVGGPVNVYRLPIGASVGHRFPMEGGMAVTPFAHPRLSVDFCGRRDRCGDAANLNVNFDLGADLELSPQLSLRGAVTFGGIGFDDAESGFGLSLAWKPALAAH